MAGSDLSAHRLVRARWYLQADKYGKSVTEVCAIFGISRKTYYKWYKRDHPEGKHGRPPRRMHPQTKLTGNTALAVIKAKKKYNYGLHKMAVYLKRDHGITVSHQAIYKFYKKKNLIRKPQKKLKWYTPLKQPYLASKPGENVQSDVKYVPGPQSAWQYQYRFLDTVTNLQFAVDMDCRDSLTTVSAFKKAQAYFPFTITGIQTDNGGEFRGSFHAHLTKNNIIHRYIPKRSAPWNGKVERANRSVDDEYYLNRTRPWKTLHAYTRWYNTERPHLGKGMDGLTPYEKYLSLAEKKCYP